MHTVDRWLQLQFNCMTESGLLSLLFILGGMMKNTKKNSFISTPTYNDSLKNIYKKPIFSFGGKFSFKRIGFLVVFIIAVTLILVFFGFSIAKSITNAPDLGQLDELWKAEDYIATYDYSKTILEEIPFNNVALTYHGYSSFYLALASTGSVAVHNYIDEAINSLRLALLDAQNKTRPQLEYMLGKTYFHKNRLSAYYFYSDLAIKYLHSAHNNGYNASDIYEYLGLSYASIDMTEESIAYFTEALLVNDSDVLHVAIAEQYYKIKNYDAAKPYLQRVKTTSSNVNYVVECSNMLGQIYLEEENYIDAQSEFENALLHNELSADAHYGLGLIYESQGDTVKARAQWRRTLDIEVNHPGARLKLI